MASSKALVVGINNFIRPQWQLRGCINDALEMQGLLNTYFGFQPEDIRVMLDRDASDRINWLSFVLYGDPHRMPGELFPVLQDAKT